VPSYDLYCDQGPLIMLVDWDWTMMPQQVPYLHPPRERVEHWRDHFQPREALHVGLVWRASPSQATDADRYTSRAVPAALLRPLMDIPGVVCHNLLHGRRGQEELNTVTPPLPIRPLSAQLLPGFADVAAAILALDAVVVVDTVIVHVAGAVGKTCLLLLPYYCEWRWLDRDQDGRWYPDCQLFRQSEPGDWTPVIEAVRQELSKQALAKSRQYAHESVL
jgi:hypothetical protein